MPTLSASDQQNGLYDEKRTLKEQTNRKSKVTTCKARGLGMGRGTGTRHKGQPSTP